MASGFDREEFEKLREYVERLSLGEKQKANFLMEEWKRICEEKRIQQQQELERQKLELEVKERKREAEERQREREANERQREVEAEERKAQREIEREEAQRRFELEKMRLEREASSSNEERERRNEESDRRVAFGRARSPDLPAFVDGKDDLDSYLLRFERYATVANWSRDNWATQLSALLSGKALDVYSRLSHEDALNYARLKAALLQRYNFTEQGYRQRFREARPEGCENPDQFVVRLRNYFSKWVELASVGDDFDGVVDLMVREQFTNACSKELSIYLMERKPKDLKEMAAIADQYLTAHNKKLSSRDSYSKKGVQKSEVKNADASTSQDGGFKCYSCGGLGHRASECPSRVQDKGKRYCYRCGALGHDAARCRNDRKYPPPPRGGADGKG